MAYNLDDLFHTLYSTLYIILVLRSIWCIAQHRRFFPLPPLKKPPFATFSTSLQQHLQISQTLYSVFYLINSLTGLSLCGHVIDANQHVTVTRDGQDPWL